MSSLMRANSPFDLGGAVDMVLLDGCGTRDRLTMRWVVAGRNGPQPRVALTAEMGMSTQRSAAVAFTGEYHEMCSPPDAGHAPHARGRLDCGYTRQLDEYRASVVAMASGDIGQLVRVLVRDLKEHR